MLNHSSFSKVNPIYMVLFSPLELLVLLKTEQLFKADSISYLPGALCPRVQSEFPADKSYTLICVYSGGWEGEREQRAVTLITSLKLIQCTLFYCALLYCASQITGVLFLCFFTNWRFVAALHQTRLLAQCSQQHLLT